MNYERKKYIFCQQQTLQKYGKKEGIQRYKCTSCNKTFSLKKSLNPIQNVPIPHVGNRDESIVKTF
ncbi:IS1/IS1595 family N-terminal zinc-binding domain-containing protein [Exercitatus varius]